MGDLAMELRELAGEDGDIQDRIEDLADRVENIEEALHKLLPVHERQAKTTIAKENDDPPIIGKKHVEPKPIQLFLSPYEASNLHWMLSIGRASDNDAVELPDGRTTSFDTGDWLGQTKMQLEAAMLKYDRANDDIYGPNADYPEDCETFEDVRESHMRTGWMPTVHAVDGIVIQDQEDEDA